MLNFDGHCDGDGNGVGKCKHTLSIKTINSYNGIYAKASLQIYILIW